MIVKMSNLADKEIFETYDYYLTKVGVDVADRFQIEINSKLEYLKNFYETEPLVKNPERKIISKHRRFLMLDKFPQHVYYFVDYNSNIIYIERILHGSRDMTNILKF